MTMKTERIQLLVTVTLKHDGTNVDRLDAIKDARQNVMAVRTLQRAEPKRVTLVKHDQLHALKRENADLRHELATEQRAHARTACQSRGNTIL